MQMATTLPDEQIEVMIRDEVKRQLEANNYRLIYTDFKQTAKLSGLFDKRLRAVVNDSKFKRMLRTENGGPVYYPRQGEGYKFDYLTFAKFCRDNMERIMNLKIAK
ncbi:DUF771 domain-containing protein [Companilactobacillus nuruki]|uniref:DUF771 domain-containing protein n=1 Tax=Companilactobacillus nuruki TaxID=1993540 RepID=A0A2N7AU08_9LACO|nr:DUF771 domain-containing protein [Companilactobacillus nuruki]PMD70282.1 hypothetical protein CBP76_07260 [Companilactobacillus nuruki]